MIRKKRLIISVGLVLLVLLVATSGVLIYDAAPWLRPDLKTARNNPMQYYISLPNNWTPDKTWPIVVTIDGANKDFLGNIKGFMRARNDLPFIIVTPFVVSNGPNNDHSPYSYSDAVWQQIAQVGVAQFDYDGLMAVLSDVRKDYNGKAKFFMSAWSA
jgi:hypothetical protein